MIMISRVKHIEEIPYYELKRLAEEFFVESRLEGVLDFDYLRSRLNTMLEQEIMGMWMMTHQGILLGVISGIITNHLMTGKLIAIEMFWFVTKQARGSAGSLRLLDEFETWAKNAGVSAITTGYTEHLNKVKMQVFYAGRGYEPLETTFIKHICHGSPQ